MKKIITIISLIAFLGAFPMRSYANISQAQITSVGRLGVPEACWVAVQILAIAGSQFNGTETLFFRNNPVANLSVLLTLGLAISLNTIILFGSPAFEAATGNQVDVPISDGDCASLQEGDEISFSGSFGATIAIMTITALFVTQLAFVLNTLSGLYDTVDLLAFSLLLTGIIALQFLVGTGPTFNPGGGGDGGGGGCALSPKSRAPSGALSVILGFLSLGALGFGLRRWRNI